MRRNLFTTVRFILPRLVSGTLKYGPKVTQRNFYSFHSNSILDQPKFAVTQSNLISKRFKKRGRKSSALDDKEADENEKDEDDDDLANENPLLMDDLVGEANDGSNTSTVNVNSLRLDSVAKVILNIPRAKIDESFYKGLIYVNGERPEKKSETVHIGDELDLVRNIDPDDHTIVNVTRVQILSLPDKMTDTGHMKVEIRKWASLNIKSHELKGKDDED